MFPCFEILESCNELVCIVHVLEHRNCFRLHALGSPEIMGRRLVTHLMDSTLRLFDAQEPVSLRDHDVPELGEANVEVGGVPRGGRTGSSPAAA